VLAYGSRNNLELSNIIQPRSAILPPIVAVWLVESKSNDKKYWLISGDVPTDHIPDGNAETARDAIRHFSLRWQLQAENITVELQKKPALTAADNTQKEFAELLISRAGSLYELHEKEEYWINS